MARTTKASGRKRGGTGSKADRLDWWREARFGMFIHWGLYAVPAGYYKGKDCPGIGEWIMYRFQIPAAEYERYAERFNPVKFNADQWARLAKQAGMKYLVITSKHHDGFAMFDSPSSDYDIVDRTPYGRDVMAALAKACKRHGLRLCFYYSQYQDWHHPNGGRNSWDYDEDAKDFEQYLRAKCFPQIRELLTQYGPIGLIWFDTPGKMARSQSVRCRRLVHKLQPTCLVSGRVGNDVGDYGSMGDNQIPAGRVVGDWETPATMNRTWGFKKQDHDWKSVRTLLHLLCDLASKGVNYLLNVGPTAEGLIPKPSVTRLEAIGTWMKVNSEAIYGTQANPYPYEFDWGRITQKRGRLYLLMYTWPRRLKLAGLRNKVKRAYLLADRRKTVEVAQAHDQDADWHELELTLPRKRPDRNVSVVVLEIAGAADVDESPLQQPDGSISLPAHMGELHVPKTGRPVRVGRGGVTENWFSRSNWIHWDVKVHAPGEFEVKVVTSVRGRKWVGGHKVKVSVGRKGLAKTIRADEEVVSPRTLHAPEAATRFGRITIARPGTHTLKLRAERINPAARAGLGVAAVRLVPVT